MKKLVSLLLTLTMVVTLAGCGGKSSQTSGTTKDPIVIGLLDAFTGNNAASGQYAKEGAEMFLEEINAKGGVLGRQVKIVYEDDQGNETAGANAYQKITSENKLSATVLSKYSSVALAMDSFIAEEKIPAICCGSSVKIEASKNNYFYSSRKSDSGSGTTIANACVNLLKMKKVAILHAPDALGTGMAPVVKKSLEDLGVQVVSLQQFTANEKNFAPYIAKIKDSGCDGIVAIAQQQEAALIMTAVNEAGIKVPCIGSSAFVQQVALQNSGKSSEGWYSVAAFSPTVSTEPTKSWIAKYTDKYKRAPDMTSALTYDALKMICDAIEKGNSDKPEDINNQLKKLNGLQGIGSTYKYKGNPMLATSEYIAHVENGKSVVVDTMKDK
jgi:ABC-type branched-chain amino acid transport systems, periplasmic component